MCVCVCVTGRDFQSDQKKKKTSDEPSLLLLPSRTPFPPSQGPGQTRLKVILRGRGSLSNYFYTKKKIFFKALKDTGMLRALRLSEALATPSLSAPSFPAPIWSGLYLLPACDRQARPGPPRDHSLPSWRPVPSETDPGPLDLICFSVCRVWGGLAWRHGGHR